MINLRVIPSGGKVDFCIDIKKVGVQTDRPSSLIHTFTYDL